MCVRPVYEHVQGNTRPILLPLKRSIVMASLGYDIQSELPCHPELLQRINTIPKLSRSDQIRSIILEAELLPYNETCRGQGRGPGIEEFWNLGRIRSNE
jgi:DNA ligase-4